MGSDAPTREPDLEPTWSLPAQPQPTAEEHSAQGNWATAPEDGEMSIVSETVASAVRAVDGMREVLTELNDSIVKMRKSRSLESRLGRLFLEAQDFVDHVRAEATDWANRIVEDAKSEAAEIVNVARDQAAQIVEEARRSSVSAEAVQSIQTTIETFNRANAELARELARLNEALAQPPQSHIADEEQHQQVHLEDTASQNVEGQTSSSMSDVEPLWPEDTGRDREAFFGPKVRRWPAAGFLGR